jgi:hypothetical protein
VEFLNVRQKPRSAGGVLRWLLVVAAWSALAAALSRAQAPAVEYAVKATDLYKFVPFVEWPPEALPPSDPLVICVVGRDRVSDLVDEAVNGQTSAGHPIRVVHGQSGSLRDAHCNILYVALRGAAAVDALDRVRGQPVLTVTDAAQEPRAAGVVNFVVIDNRVRFEIDQHAAAENHLVISSKLLSLAIRVTPRP